MNITELNSHLVDRYFGNSSSIYKETLIDLKSMWEGIDKDFQKYNYLHWKKRMDLIYEETKFSFKLYFHHIYLLIVIQEIIIQYLKSNKINKNIINNLKLIKSLQLEQNIEFHFVQWIYNQNHQNAVQKIKKRINNQLAKFTIDNICDDIYFLFYHNLVHNIRPVKSNEYYTPNWLSEYLINQVVELMEDDTNYRNKRTIHRVIDPTCGSGTFLINLIKYYNNQNLAIEIYIRNIHGSDINPIAAYMARANYLLALPKTWSSLDPKNCKMLPNPIMIKDTLKTSNIANLEKYDLLIGNPPWGVMRFISNDDMKEQLKKEIFGYKILLKRDTHLFSQFEIASIFFCKTVDYLLKNGGYISYIMPKSVILQTKHLFSFQKFEQPKVQIKKILDLQNVKPLFGNPACVIIGKKGQMTNYPIPYDKISILTSNPPNKKASIKLQIVKEKYSLSNHNLKGNSPYFNKFRTGASIFPRALYFVDIDTSLIYDNIVQIKSSPDVRSRTPWNQFKALSALNSRYLFSTILAWEIIPFGFTQLRYVALPVKITENKFVLLRTLDECDIQSKEWFTKTNQFWNLHRTEKSSVLFPNLVDRLNYNNLLLKQNPMKKYILLQNGTGKNICACVVNRNRVKTELNYFTNEFIADVKTWTFETHSLHEAHYLCAILNSEYLNGLIKPLQPHGLGGPRAVNRIPLEFPIPHFDLENEIHLFLVNLSIQGHKEVSSIHLKGKKRIRKLVREELHHTLKSIDELVMKLLS